jgi:N-methylhydantoinase B
VWLTIRSILLDTAVHGHIPVNEGLTRPIRIVAPLGCLANPIFPAPTIARFAPGNQLADTVMKALAQVVPKQVSAGIGNLRVMAFSGEGAEGAWVHMEIFEGSYGGRDGADGMDAVDTLYANTRNNPVEDIESHLPLRVRRYELRTDAMGHGRWRGGLGAVREFELLSESGVSIEGDGHRHRPWGFGGGSDGFPATLQVHSGNTVRELPSKMPYRRMQAGDRFLCIGPCGGGYGPAVRRDPAAVRQDVLDGLLSPAAAVDMYGVVLSPALEVDAAATAAARAGML